MSTRDNKWAALERTVQIISLACVVLGRTPFRGPIYPCVPELI
jgi:hypothetical protein